MAQTKKNDFIELSFTGYANGNIFDSNIEEDLKKIDPKAKVEKFVIVIGQEMVVPGLDKVLENKEIGKEYEIEVPYQDGFGARKKELVRILPLKQFVEKKVNPQPGMMLALDNNIVKILAVSGARVTTDFNNPLAGKNLKYKFKVDKIVTDEKEKAETLFKFFLRFVPEFEVKEKEIVIKGPKGFEIFVKPLTEKFKEILGKDLGFEVKEIKKTEEKSHEKSEPENLEVDNE